MLKLSRYLKVLQKNGVVAVFHSLMPSPIFLPFIRWNRYLQEKKELEIEKYLIRKKLLIPPGEDKEVLEEVKRNYLSSDDVSILYLILTKACNFTCRYCFQPERHPELFPCSCKKKTEGRLFMSREIAKRGIDLFARYVQKGRKNKEVQIQFYGGEPFLNIKTLKFAVEYIGQLQRSGLLPKETKKIIVTNGSLITDNLGKYLKKHEVSIGLSLDGRKAENDVFRKPKDGGSAYNYAIGALKKLQQYSVPATLSITITPLTAEKLTEIARWAKEELGVRAIGFNIAGGKTYGYFGSSLPKEKYDDLITKGLIEVFKYGRRVGLYEDRMMRKVEAFVKGYFYASDCGAIKEQLVIQPDGNVAFCHASEEYNMGNVFSKKPVDFNHPILKRWEKRVPLNNPLCQDCFAISICGGGCHHNVRELVRPADESKVLDEGFCKHTKETMEFLVWDLYQKSKE